MNLYRRAVAEIDLDAILYNVGQMGRHIAAGAKIMAVIKADGYGHGAVPIGKELEPLDIVWGYAVATAEEAWILRRNGLEKPILVLGAVFPEQYQGLVGQEIRPTIYSLQQAEGLEEFLSRQGTSLPVHVKIDTGLSRLGFQATEKAAGEVAQIAGMGHIIVEGLFTHFAKSDAKDKSIDRKSVV